MKIRSSIQVKAAVLIIVFLLNTVVGFACAIGMNMESNSNHYQEHKITLVREGSHEHNEAHEHDNIVSSHHSSKKLDDNCCKDEVYKITKGDKIVEKNFDYKLLISPLIGLLNATYFTGWLRIFPVNTINTYFVWQYRPPISDVRIAIQSFQI